MNAKVLVIVGMHRSGTSMITQWLYRCGLFIGNNLIGPAIGNEQGHFEDEDFLRLHRKFLKKRNFPDSGFIHKNHRQFQLSELEKMELKGVIETKSLKHGEWGWKEPRTTLFLDDYNQMIPGAFYVLVVRSFNATVNSLIVRQHKMEEKRFQTKKGFSRLKWKLFKRQSLDKMYQKETNRYLKIWIYYYERILQHIHTLSKDRFIVVNYTELKHDDNYFFSKLKTDWAFSLNYLPFLNIYESSLLSEERDISKYITNKELGAKAKAIENEIFYAYTV